MTQQFQEWVLLVITSLCSLISVLLGVIIGGGITYLNQSKFTKQQREWDLDDRKRRWQRENLKELETHIDKYVIDYLFTLNKTQLNKFGAPTPMPTEKFIEEITKRQMNFVQYMANVDISFDPILSQLLLSDWYEIINKSLGYNSFDQDTQNQIINEAYLINQKIKKRFNELYEATYS